MDYRRPLPVFSGIYRPLPTRRFIVTTLGGLFPVIQKLPDGRLGVVARGGDFHVGERGTLVFVTSADGGESWSHATVVAAEGPDNRNPAFGVAADGTLLVSYMKLDTYIDGIRDPSTGRGGATPIYICRSEDGGATWSEGEVVVVNGKEQWSDDAETGASGPDRVYSPYGKMITLPDATVIMHYYGPPGEAPDESAAYLIRSHDGGRTWVDPVTIAEGYDETAICHLGDGRLLAMMRNGRLWGSDSTDGGYSWSEPRPVTDEFELPGDVIRLEDGRLLLTYGRRVPPNGVQGMVSRDEGRTWDSDHKLFLVGDSSTRDCGYPSSVQLDDGTIVTVYYACDPVSEAGKASNRLGPHGAALLYRPEDIP